MLSLTTGQAASNPVHVNLRVPVDDVRPQSVTLPNVGPSHIQWGRPADVYTPVCSQWDFWCHHSHADDAIGRFSQNVSCKDIALQNSSGLAAVITIKMQFGIQCKPGFPGTLLQKKHWYKCCSSIYAKPWL